MSETGREPSHAERMGSANLIRRDRRHAAHYSHRIVLFVDDSFQNATVIRPATSDDACSAITDEKA